MSTADPHWFGGQPANSDKKLRKDKIHNGPKTYTNGEIEDQKRQALALWRVNTPYTRIAKQIGVTDKTAKLRVEAALDDHRPHADWIKYLTESLAHIDAAIAEMSRIMSTSQDERTRISAADSLVKIVRERLSIVGGRSSDVPVDELSSLSDAALLDIVGKWMAEENAKNGVEAIEAEIVSEDE